jgi:hypothetical protein
MQFPAISIPPGTAPSRAQASDPGPSAGSLPLAERRAVIEGLRGATTTPQRCWFCVWEGWGLDERGVQARVDLPGRRYLLYAGPLETALAPLPGGGPGTAYLVTWSADGVPDEVPDPPEGWQAQSPNLWWPEDRAWFVATEIDAASTYVGGSADLIERLMADPRLEALPCQRDDSLFLNSDVLNR